MPSTVVMPDRERQHRRAAAEEQQREQQQDREGEHLGAAEVLGDGVADLVLGEQRAAEQDVAGCPRSARSSPSTTSSSSRARRRASRAGRPSGRRGSPSGWRLTDAMPGLRLRARARTCVGAGRGRCISATTPGRGLGAGRRLDARVGASGARVVSREPAVGLQRPRDRPAEDTRRRPRTGRRRAACASGGRSEHARVSEHQYMYSCQVNANLSVMTTASPPRNPRGEGNRLREQLLAATAEVLNEVGDAEPRLGARDRPPRRRLARPRCTSSSRTATRSSTRRSTPASRPSTPTLRPPRAVPGTPEERLTAMGLAYLAFSEHQPALYAILFSARRPVVDKDVHVDRDQASTASSPCCSRARRRCRAKRRASSRSSSGPACTATRCCAPSARTWPGRTRTSSFAASSRSPRADLTQFRHTIVTNASCSVAAGQAILRRCPPKARFIV